MEHYSYLRLVFLISILFLITVGAGAGSEINPVSQLRRSARIRAQALNIAISNAEIATLPEQAPDRVTTLGNTVSSPPRRRPELQGRNARLINRSIFHRLEVYRSGANWTPENRDHGRLVGGENRPIRSTIGKIYSKCLRIQCKYV